MTSPIVRGIPATDNTGAPSAEPRPVIQVPADTVIVDGRVRRDLGDLDALAASIRTVGLLHPIVIDADCRLLAGERRLAVFRREGWATIPATVASEIADVRAALVAERDENTCRKDFAPSEAVAMVARLEPLERAAAKDRQRAAGRDHGRGIASEKFTEAIPANGAPVDRAPQSMDRTAAAVGVSRPTLVKAQKVVDAAAEDPDRFAPLVEEMDRTGKVDTAFRALKEARREERRDDNRRAIETAPTLDAAVVSARFATIVIDPPWDWGDEGDDDQLGRARPTYATMPFDDLLRLPIGDRADVDCHLYLWITNRSLPKGFALLEAWGFRYITCLTWCKPSFGMGNYFRGQTEQILFGVKGSQALRRKDVGTCFTAPRGPLGHSSKPVEFYGLVESCSPGPYLEVFARGERDGWVSWGGEL